MVIICATTSTPPIATKISAIRQVMIDAFTGSLSLIRVLLNHLLADCMGMELSMAMACSVRGPTITDPNAGRHPGKGGEDDGKNNKQLIAVHPFGIGGKIGGFIAFYRLAEEKEDD